MSLPEILSLLDQGHRAVALLGCPGSYLALLLARLGRAGRFPSPLVVVTPDEERAQDLARDLSFFLAGAGAAVAGPSDEPLDLPRVMHLPPIETSPYAEISFDRVAMMQRMTTLFRLSQGYVGELLVASASSLRRRVVPRRGFVELCDLWVAEEELERDGAVARLLACGFTRAAVVEDPGTFAVRGGLLDLFPPLGRYPVRIEFVGDLVESIRLFDPTTQRTLRPVREVLIHPVRETVVTAGTDLRARVLQAADEASHPSRSTRALLEELETGREFFGIEALTPAFHERRDPLSSYRPAEALYAVVDPEAAERQLVDEDRQSEEAYRSRLGEARLTFPPAAFFAGAGELWRELATHARLEVPIGERPGTPAVRYALETNHDLVAELTRARSERSEETVRVLAARLRRWGEEGRPVIVAAGGPAQVDRLEALLKGHTLRPTVLRDLAADELLAADPPSGALQLRQGELGAGFRVPGGLVVLVEEEIFGPKARRRPPRRFAGRGVGDLRELRDGDFVVHVQHGVGAYHGLVKLEIRGVPADFLLLEYAGGDRLYLPVYRMDQVQKFAAGDGVEPKIDRLGGVTWEKKKGKVKGEVRKLAEELLQLYAQRAALQGHALPPGGELYAEFEATFPFTETPDQAEAVQQTLRDLQSPRPMDRLVSATSASARPRSRCGRRSWRRWAASRWRCSRRRRCSSSSTAARSPTACAPTR
jgi:transcription-repair coupling factor (superfamily II helicase)